jgi:mannose/fructose/N-acetylgalactosamine-specific phosphotransferase system component IIC
MRVPSKSLSQVLAESHISAVAIAVLLLWTFDWGARCLWTLVVPAADFVVNAIGINGIPYAHIPVIWTFTVLYLISSFLSLAAAWLLSRWVYGVGPLRSLTEYRRRSNRRNHA